MREQAGFDKESKTKGASEKAESAGLLFPLSFVPFKRRARAQTSAAPLRWLYARAKEYNPREWIYAQC